MAESRNGSFYEGKKPALINVHEAYTTGKIAKEEAQDLNPKYAPEKVVGVYKKAKDSTGTQTKTQGHRLDSVVKQRKEGKGNYKYKGKTNNG
jgi:hypothetical protein